MNIINEINYLMISLSRNCLIAIDVISTLCKGQRMSCLISLKYISQLTFKKSIKTLSQKRKIFLTKS